MWELRKGQVTMTVTTTVRHSRRPAIFWVVVKKETGQEEDVLTLDLGDEEEALPVFCFEEEARMFLSFGVLGDGWRLRKTTAGELKEKLLGPWSDVEFVALDPMPELVLQRMVGLVSVRREQFVDGFASRFIENEEYMDPLVG